MKTLKFIQSSIFILIVISCYGCHKSDNSIDTIDPTKLYTGIIIAGDCPSYAVIEVSNANIGEDWIGSNCKTYKNVIAISNCPDSIKTSSISFNLIDSGNYLDCVIQKPCLTDITIELPSKIYCAKNIKSSKK
jgi:hypothetical protein